jgi:hypothetical protein
MKMSRMSHAMKDVLDAWDTLQTFTNYGRGTPEGIAAFVRRYEIQEDLDGWLENKYANVIEEYATLNDVSFEQAQKELQRRPISRPEPLRKPPQSEDPFKWHMKPHGWTGAPCPICGCTTKNLRAKHRALKADEAFEYGAPFMKRVKVAFGTDWSDELLRE